MNCDEVAYILIAWAVVATIFHIINAVGERQYRNAMRRLVDEYHRRKAERD